MDIKQSDFFQSQEYLIQKLTKFNEQDLPSASKYEFEEISFSIFDKGIIVGSIYGYIEYFGWLYISLFYIEKSYRHRGLGTKLLNKMEQFAQDKKCQGIYLNTWDFQAKEFYLKNGYQLFGVFDRCLDHHEQYYLRKNIST